VSISKKTAGLYHKDRDPGSSVSRGSYYGLDDRDSIHDSCKGFSSIFRVKTDCGADPVSCTMGMEDPFPGGKVRPGRDADHSPPPSAEVKKQ
jgi:hypothetical protein